ncbi:MAG: acetate--CoA ligase family protein, partial [Deltaproteobacteria bacterium]
MVSPRLEAIASFSNPIDLTGSAVDEDFVAAAKFLSKCQEVDCVLILLLPYSPGITSVRCLKARPLLDGYRGREPVNLDELTRMLKTFSDLVMDLETEIESIDLNPVICS